MHDSSHVHQTNQLLGTLREVCKEWVGLETLVTSLSPRSLPHCTTTSTLASTAQPSTSAALSRADAAHSLASSTAAASDPRHCHAHLASKEQPCGARPSRPVHIVFPHLRELDLLRVLGGVSEAQVLAVAQLATLRRLALPCHRLTAQGRVCGLGARVSVSTQQGSRCRGTR